MVPAIGYCRVSRPELETGSQSLTMQEERIRLYAPSAGLDLTEVVIEDGVSAGKPLIERPQGRYVVEKLRSGEAKAFVALRLDRVFRDTLDALKTIEAFDKGGIAVHFVDFGGQSFDSTSPLGKFVFTMQAAFAEMERMKIGERIRENKASRRKHGRSYAVPRFGHVNDAGKVSVESDEQIVLKRIAAARSKGWSYAKIAAALNEAEVPTKQGGARWYASTVHTILTRETGATP